MQVRQVPFLQELGKRMPASCADASNDREPGASNSHPWGAMATEKEALMRPHLRGCTRYGTSSNRSESKGDFFSACSCIRWLALWICYALLDFQRCVAYIRLLKNTQQFYRLEDGAASARYRNACVILPAHTHRDCPARRFQGQNRIRSPQPLPPGEGENGAR